MTPVFVVTLGDVFGLFVLALCVLAAVAIGLLNWRRQTKCKHVAYTETQACDAICRDCGKNLGFIGAWRAVKK